jgi:hypothetical protein
VDVGTRVEVGGGDVGEGGSGVFVGMLSVGEHAATIMRKAKPTVVVTRIFILFLRITKPDNLYHGAYMFCRRCEALRDMFMSGLSKQNNTLVFSIEQTIAPNL